MAGIKEFKPQDFGQFMRFVEKFQGLHSSAWFRGAGKAEDALIPTSARRADPATPAQVVSFERSICSTFAQRSPPFVDIAFPSELKSLFFMQHYGIPTRLLDWSESPFVALFFSLTSGQRGSDGSVVNDAAVWLCDPVLWNRAALSHISFQGGILDESCEEIKAYHPNVELEQRTMAPVMIYGTHNSPRIVAQRGVFALFGQGLEPMETLASKSPYPSGVLQKVVIKAEHVQNILQGLFKNGVAESTIYPDLFGLSLEIRRVFGY